MKTAHIFIHKHFALTDKL